MGVKSKTNASRDRYSENASSNSKADTTRATDSTSNTSANSTGSSNTSANSLTEDTLKSLTNSNKSSLNETAGKRSAVFDSPQGSAVLNSLTSRATGGPDYSGNAAGIYDRLGRGGVDPNVENIIRASDTEANKNFSGRLAETRAGAYRGGTAANIGKQGQLAADFSAQQAGNNAKIRSDAYNNANTMALGAASGLGGLGANRDTLGASILSMLRGEATTGAARGTEAGTTAVDQTGSSNVASNTLNNTANNTNTSTQTTERMLQTILEALTGNKSGTKSTVGSEVSAGFGGMSGG